MEELKSDPNRQAIHALQGYSYQIWQSLLRWVCLKEDERLFLEGAEDIDLHGPSGVETVQVKATDPSRTLTLRSPDILEAIANLWWHRQKNPDVKITFRFLTTAERGSERPNPFGKHKGLDLWDKCKYPGSNPQGLRDFLSGEQVLPADLRNFIKAATDEELRLQLLMPMEWDTGNQPQVYVEDAVTHKVSGYGDRIFGLQHSESIKVIPWLLRHVFDAARQKGSRWLDGTDFRRLFEEAITERIPKPELQGLRRAAATATQLEIQPEMLGIVGVGDLKLTRSAWSVLQVLTPPHNERLVQRKQLVAELLDKLNTEGLLVLKGSNGMGKSTLATAVAMTGPGTWRWLDMRGVDSETVKSRLLYAAHLIEDGGEQIDCIVDDLNFDRRPDIYENALARLIYAMKLVNGRLIITTQGMLPSRIIGIYDIHAESLFEVPLLSERDVAELISNHSCPAGDGLDAWSRIIYVTTQGHPQLAHACVKSEEAKKWPSPAFNDLLTPPGIDEIRRDIRRRLNDQLSSEDAKTLLYRLCIFTGRFERQQALHLSNLDPQIMFPGEAFDSLVGPWIEPVDEKHFRLSPLIENTAKEIFPEQKWLELQRAAAHSFLELPKIDLLGLSYMLIHAFFGRDRESLAAIVLSVFSDEREFPWKEWGQLIGWFQFVKLERDERLVEEDPFLNEMMRRMQFRVAAETNPEMAVKIAGVWEREVRQMRDQQLPAEVSRMSLLVFLNEVTSADRVPFPMLTAVSYLYENYRVLKNLKAYLPETVVEEELLVPGYPSLADARLFLLLAKKRCKSARDVLDLLAALDNLTGDEVEELWRLLSEDDIDAMLLIDTGWLAERLTDSPDWKRYLEDLAQALSIATARKATSLIVAIYRARAIVLKEYCDDRDGALASLEDGERAIGHQHLFLQEYRAKIYYLEERYDEALAIWREVLPALENDQNKGRIYVYRDAAMCAAAIGCWSEAADLFRRGSETARLPPAELPPESKYRQDHTIEYSFKAERAFALWKAGERAGAVRELADIVGAYTTLPRGEENLQSLILYRRIGHAIGWMYLEMNGVQTLAEPKPGYFTDREVGEGIKEALSKSSALTITHLWYYLAKLEHKLLPGDSIFRQFESEWSKSPQPSLMLGYYDLRLRHSLGQLQVDRLIDDYLIFSAGCNAHGDRQSEAAGLKEVLFSALIRFLSEGRRREIPIARWREDIDNHTQLIEEVGKWLDFVHEHIDEEPQNLRTILTDPSAGGDHRLLAALLLTATTDLDPETLFYANAILIHHDYGRHWQDAFADGLASVISREWERIVDQQSFALRSPRLNGPAILSACRDVSRRGMRKAATILLSANDAVQISIDGAILGKLRETAERE